MLGFAPPYRKQGLPRTQMPGFECHAGASDQPDRARVSLC
jgi:hypothetical protein